MTVVGKVYGGVGACGTMRVHASPSLNKRGQDVGASVDNVSGIVVRPGQSPVKQNINQVWY